MRISMSITVLIPTYRRPQDLRRCLEALTQQTRSADQVVVIVRDIDIETRNLLQQCDFTPLPIQTVTVIVPGQVAALNAGLDVAAGDMIAITDDDAAPHADWLSRIEAHFLADEQVGGVGGRDWMYLGKTLQDASTLPGASQLVGRVQWCGRVTGNHHIGEGSPREVDILKGANMSYRRSAIAHLRFDQRLQGTGAQVHNDMAFSLTVRSLGWKLIYDPVVAVNHYLAERFDEDQRKEFNQIALINAVHNETLTLLEYLPPAKRVIFIVWAICVGTRDALGLVQCLRLFKSEKTLAVRKWVTSMHGRWQGFWTWQRDRQRRSKQSLREDSFPI
jgi:cellulose synthase/poly-beta-1,6-N-acetylglucosamine synthase-like glycosyltransferase